MPSYTSIYQDTRSVRTSSKSKKLKKNWRTLKTQILKEEKLRFIIDLKNEIYRVMKNRAFFLQWRTDKYKPLPKLSPSTLAWRLSMGYSAADNKPLLLTKNLRDSFKRPGDKDASVILVGNTIKVINKARNKRGEKYAEFLNEINPTHKNPKRWVNLDIPEHLLSTGEKRRAMVKNFKLRLEQRYSLELYIKGTK